MFFASAASSIPVGSDSGTVTLLVKRLMPTGLVTKARSAGDERRVDIALTNTGRALEKVGSHTAVHSRRGWDGPHVD